MYALCTFAVLLAADAGAPSGRPDGGARPSFLPAPAGAAAAPSVYRLVKREDGAYSFDSGPFEAVIDRVGAVTFHDHHGVASLLLPLPQPLPEGTPTLEGSVRDLLGRKRAATGPSRPKVPPGGALLEVCERRRECPDPAVVVSALGGTFDLTDEILRLLGEDPYRYQKARFLAATSTFRLELARKQRARRVRDLVKDLDADLAQVWADARFVPGERRRLLFHRWLEMDASPEGRKAAAVTEAFIRRTLPAGSKDAFTPAELQALDRLAAPRRFNPYGD
jgi:hypothetical protein